MPMLLPSRHRPPHSVRPTARRPSRRAIHRVIVAAVMAGVSIALGHESASASTVIVGAGGHPTISQAVQASVPGDVIRIRTGTYGEEVLVNKAVTLEAFGDGPVWVDGACIRQSGFHIISDDVTVSDLGVKRTAEAGIRLDSADNVVLDGLTIQDYNCAEIADQYRAGIAAWFGSTKLAVTDSTITRRVELAGPQTGYGNGIWIKNTSTAVGGGHYIAGNTIVGGYDGIGGEPEDALYGSYYKDTTIENNNVTDCWDDGIQVEGGDINITVRENTIERCAIGIALAPNLQGPLFIQHNTILDLQPGNHGAVYAFKIGDGSTGITYLEDNVVVTQGDGIKQSNPGVGPIVSRRNVLQVTRRVIEIQSPIPQGTSYDEDCVWSTDPTRFIEWQSEEYLTLAAFNGATGEEPNGIESTDCAEIPTPTPTLPPLEDADQDGMLNGDEYACGSDPQNASSTPELLGGPFAGFDDDADTQIDEASQYSGDVDCDQDGFSSAAENHVYGSSTNGDQYPCGSGTTPGWPLDLVTGGVPDSTNRVNILDLASFVAPTRHLLTNVGTNPGDIRWDLRAGPHVFIWDINIFDYASLATGVWGYPPMLGGQRALAGPPCPWP